MEPAEDLRAIQQKDMDRKMQLDNFVKQHKAGLDKYFSRLTKEFPHVGGTLKNFIFGNGMYNINHAIEICRSLQEEADLLDSKIHMIIQSELEEKEDQKKVEGAVMELGKYFKKGKILKEVSQKLRKYGRGLEYEEQKTFRLSDSTLKLLDHTLDTLAMIKKLIRDSAMILQNLRSQDQNPNVTEADLKSNEPKYHGLRVLYTQIITRLKELQHELRDIDIKEKIYIAHILDEIKLEEQVEEEERRYPEERERMFFG